MTDNTSYYLIQALHSSDPLFISRAVETVYQIWDKNKPNFFQAVWHILRVMLSSLTWRNCPGRIKTIGYLWLYAPQVWSTVFNQVFSKIRRLTP